MYFRHKKKQKIKCNLKKKKKNCAKNLKGFTEFTEYTSFNYVTETFGGRRVGCVVQRYVNHVKNY